MRTQARCSSNIRTCSPIKTPLNTPSPRSIRALSAGNSFKPINRNGIKASGGFMLTPRRLKKRFSIDEKRVTIRGFSQGGEGAWHIALHHPDRFAAAEIGAGTVSRTAQRPGLTPYQLATLRIWENISEWALNIHNLPLAGHDGENDPGQLESSLRARAQLEKEGFPSVGDPDYLRSQGAPGLWMVSKETR